MFETKIKITRCVIYTRKSTEEGLGQAFNSLDAQREACEAYIKSQAHEGWVLIEKQYNDGGFSGGNTNRPSLVQLMDDIESDEIDLIVVYKVDRLSRSLADFSNMVGNWEWASSRPSAVYNVQYEGAGAIKAGKQSCGAVHWGWVRRNAGESLDVEPNDHYIRRVR